MRVSRILGVSIAVAMLFAASCGNDDDVLVAEGSAATSSSDASESVSRSSSGTDDGGDAVAEEETTTSTAGPADTPADGSGTGQPEPPSSATSSPPPPPTSPPAPPAKAPTPPTSGSGVTGVVTVGPQCPVIAEGQACDPAPVSGTTVTIRKGTGSGGRVPTGGDVVATTETDANGGFLADLAPGDYVVEAQADGARSCTPAAVEVTEDAYSRVTVSCDSGVR